MSIPRSAKANIHLSQAGDSEDGMKGAPPRLDQSRLKIDKSLLTISEPKRYRSKEHLRFVAQQPCLICGRMPSQAHHIRFAQPKGLGLKVSDEFTVPLCAIHHTMNHATGDERRWWQENNVDPLAVALQLWRETHPLTTSSPISPDSSDEVEALSD